MFLHALLRQLGPQVNLGSIPDAEVTGVCEDSRLAQPGSLRVCPPDSHVAQIRSDYRDMGEMFFGEAPPFDQIIADLKEVEDRVNS